MSEFRYRAVVTDKKTGERTVTSPIDTDHPEAMWRIFRVTWVVLWILTRGTWLSIEKVSRWAPQDEDRFWHEVFTTKRR